jgi:hypothetical protein
MKNRVCLLRDGDPKNAAGTRVTASLSEQDRGQHTGHQEEKTDQDEQ